MKYRSWCSSKKNLSKRMGAIGRIQNLWLEVYQNLFV